MSSTLKKISSPFATGGGGIDFEHDVQSAFVVLMLTNGVFHHLGHHPIRQIDLQAKYRGYNTDDIVVYCTDENGRNQRKMIAQIKHKIQVSKTNEEFKNTIIAAWADYNNPKLFDKNKDIIAIITGLLPKTETYVVRGLLENARAAKDFDDFNTRLNTKLFCDSRQQHKFQIFKSIINDAKEDSQINDKEIYEFLKVLHLFIYDLDVKGITLSLLKSVIEQHSPQNSGSVWAQIQSYVRDVDKSAGCITLDCIPDDIKSYFKNQKAFEIPDKYVFKQEQLSKQLVISNYAHELTQAFLIGSWNENKDADKQAISLIVKKDYSAWILKMREIIQFPNSPLQLKNGIWSIEDRLQFFYQVKNMIFDEDLDSLKSMAAIVLKEKDPQFELESDQRYAAQIYGKVTEYSSNIKAGIVEGLAIIGSHAEDITYCSKYKPENTIYSLLEDIFKDADWQIWAGLNQQLPLLFEASPKKMLENIEYELSKKNNVFSELFKQEGTGIFGGCCYITGILWGLERLAWSSEFLPRVTLILGELASIDPGGNWGNRPANSLSDIFLPWHPQTTATVQQRITAINALNTEFPDIAWHLLIALLPLQHQTTCGTAKPVYRNYVPKDWKVKVLQKDYIQQVLVYSNLLVDKANGDINKIKELLKYINNLPLDSLNKYLDILDSKFVLTIEENKRTLLWEDLKSLIARHKHFCNSDWAMKGEKLDRLEDIANKLTPKNLLAKYARLFDHSIFEEVEEPFEKDKSYDYKETEKRVDVLRLDALKKMLEEYDFKDLIDKFLKKVKNTHTVGWILGKIEDANYDKYIIPKLLNDKKSEIRQFAAAYISSKFSVSGWQWVDNISFTDWSNKEISTFYTYLPFDTEIWERVSSISKPVENLYWKTVEIHTFGHRNIDTIIDKMIKYKRPIDLINAISSALYMKKNVEPDKIICALNMYLENKKAQSSEDCYHITRLIKQLQSHTSVLEDDLLSIEIKYFRLLNNDNGVKPVTVNRKLCDDAEFFCECIQMAYKSDKEDKRKKTLSKQDESMAKLAWEILRQWKIPPGTNTNGEFDEQAFENWYQKAVKICTESGHLDVCLLTIGSVLFYTPKDKSGLFINKEVANILNNKENELLRRAYRSECINSRGVHFVDKTAKQEKELAEKYTKQAQSAEREGYVRLSGILKELAENYEEEAKRILEKPYY